MVEYRNVPHFTGYRVGNDGSVWTLWGKGRSIVRGNMGTVWHQLQPGLASHGYLTVALSRGHGCETRTVHSLVIEAFIGPPPQGQLCRHKDGNYLNCRAENLEYGTQLENMADAERHGRIARGFKLPHTRLSDDDVTLMRQLVLQDGISQAAVAVAFTTCQSHVSKICSGRKRLLVT